MGDDGVQEAFLNDGDDIDGHLLDQPQLASGVCLVEHLLQPRGRLLLQTVVLETQTCSSQHGTHAAHMCTDIHVSMFSMIFTSHFFAEGVVRIWSPMRR